MSKNPINLKDYNNFLDNDEDLFLKDREKILSLPYSKAFSKGKKKKKS